jgi:glutamate-ammonia-ligase adenylyltransferase
LRARPTLQASAALCAGGLLSSREADDLAAAYTALRRAEHAVQWASGVQTHEIPSGDDLERLARAVGAASASELTRSLEQHRERIAGLFQSLLPGVAPFASPWKAAVDELDRGDADAFAGALEQSGMPWAREAAHELFELARIPDSPLGASSRERHRELAVTVLGSIADSADPEQAARYLRRVLGRIRHREIYTKLLADDPASIRRLCTVLGASAFIGEAAAIRPELADLILFEAGAVTPHDARDEIAEALAIARATLSPEADEQERVESFVGALRRAKSRIAARVALADLAGMIDTRAATLVLSELADASLDAATRVALGVDGGGEVEGLTILALGKLGGRDIGYGSDLDVLFLYDSSQAGGSARGDELTRVTRRAQRIIGLVSMPHVDGRGYQLDTRLRPSGNQGLLVTSLDGFARYHDRSQRHAGERAATWERLTLLRARVAAGDRSLGERALAIAQRAAYEDDADLAAMAADVDRLRGRMERELAREKEGRHDLKFGRGGLMDIELGVQLLQLAHGRDPRARTTDTAQAIEALAGIGAVDRWQHEALREGYTFLRKLEQRLRVVHDDDAHLIEESAAGLPKLARRMGIAAGDPAAELMAQYRSVTVRVRRCYQQIIEMR